MKGKRLETYTYAFPAFGIALAILLMVLPDIAPGHAGAVPAVAGILSIVLLCGASFATVDHADMVAVRLGQPFGTLVLTLSVTIIEVSVIASMMLHGADNPTLARESVFSVIMIVNTGIVGLCLLLGSLKHREQTIQQQGVSGFLSVMIALAVMLLILPSETHQGSHGSFIPFQLVYMSFIAVALYGTFLYMQTVRYAEHYGAQPEEHGAEQMDRTRFLVALVLLVASLVAVVLLSEHVATVCEGFISGLNLPDPDAVTGALVAALILMPEGISAVRAAARNHLQHSLNIALGSAVATISLTIPTMAMISVMLGLPMVLGLDNEDRTMMLLTFVLAVLSFGTGRTNALNGVVHLILFCVYVMLLFVP